VTGWNFAVPDWADRLRAGRSLLPDLPLDLKEANRGVEIFNKLRLPDVPGQPSMREGAGEWLRDIVRAVAGSMVDGERMVREIFALVGKKNSKTTGGAGIMLTLMLMNERPRAELTFTAPTQEVSDLAFQQVAGMIEADPENYLQKRFHVQHHLKTITDRRNKAFAKIKTFDMNVITGSKPVVILIDELHLMSKMSYASRVLGQIRGGMIANPEAILIMISTQSDEPPAGVFKSELQYARGVRDGRITDDVRTLPLLYEFPEEMQRGATKAWADPANWPMVMPNLGKSIHLPRLISEYRTAVEKGPEEERRWASQHLNVEIGLALHSDRWPGADYWESAADRTITFETLLERCEVVVAGVDGGGLDDLFAFAALGRDRITKDWLLWEHAWCDPIVLEKRKDIAETLRDFERDGDLTIVEEPTQDLKEAAAYVARIRDAGLLPEKAGVGLDRYGIGALVDELAEQRITGDQLIAVQQGAALSPASWGMERKLKDGTLWHHGSKMMAWCVSNAKTEQRGNAVLITKQLAGRAKIDPLIAAFNTVMLMSRNPVAAGGVPDLVFL
jgi:phage terminase large subunit-like protein